MGKQPEVIGDMPSSLLGMCGDLFSKLKSGARTPRQLELFLKGQNPFVATGDIRQEWEEFWLGLGVATHLVLSLSEVAIPDDQSGFEQVLMIPAGLTLDKAWELCQKRFPCSSYRPIAGCAVKNDRDPVTAGYAVRCRYRVEADDELKSLSAETLAKRGHKTLTLLERIVYELWYFTKTGKHLDVENWTLCAGSRTADGSVPDAGWRGDAFCVRASGVRDAGSGLRARSAVMVASQAA